MQTQVRVDGEATSESTAAKPIRQKRLDNIRGTLGIAVQESREQGQ